MAGGDKMKFLTFTQKLYQDIGLIPPESNQNYNSIISTKWLMIFCEVQMFISSAAYVLFEAKSAIEYGMAFLSCTTVLVCSTLYLTLLWQTANILSYIKNCELFVEMRMQSTAVYKETIEKIERLTEYFAGALFVTDVILLVPPLLYTMFNYYVLDAEKESFFLFWSTWWPFDWKTPFGYLVAWVAQSVGTSAMIASAVSFFNIVFGSSWLFIVIVEDITCDVATFNNTVKTQKERNERAELIKCFWDIMRHYSDAKQSVSANFTHLSQFDHMKLPSIDLYYSFSAQWDNNPKLVETVILSVVGVWVLCYNMGICEFGERVTNQFDQFGVEFGRCEWNKLPLEMQRLYLIFLSNTQQSKNIRCYGGIQCTRDTFKTITTKGFSYFMTLRRFRA